MIAIQNNVLPEEVFKKLQDYCYNNEFQIITRGSKQFSVLKVPEEVLPYLQLAGHKIILTFIRQAYKGFDLDMRIHNDYIIENELTSMASVLYINKQEGVTPNGTAFYNHHAHGIKAPDDLSEEEFNRLILEDSNDLSKWKQLDYVSNIPNRMVTYQSSLFHSKIPKEIEQGRRVVLVAFYAKL